MSSGNGLQMEVHDGVDRVDAGRWNALRDADNPWTDLAFLKATEDAHVVECAPRYFEFRDDGRAICTMSGGVLVNDMVMFADNALKHLVAVVRRLFPSYLKRTMLEIGPLLGLGTSISHVSGMSPERWRDIARMITGYAREHRIDLVVLRDFSGRRHPIEDALGRSGFRAFFNLPLATMNIAWDSFDDYLMALRKPVRNNIRRKIKRKEAHGIRTVFTDDGLEHLERCLELYENVRRRSSRFNRDALSADYFRSMVAHFRRHSLLLEYFRGDTLVAFAHLVRYRKQVIAQYVGMDYDVSRRAALYFNSYYDMLRLALDEGLECVEAGITTYEPKSALGFSVIPQVMYVWMPSASLLNAATVLWHRTASYGIEKCHYAFKGRKPQELWDGRTRQAPAREGAGDGRRTGGPGVGV